MRLYVKRKQTRALLFAGPFAASILCWLVCAGCSKVVDVLDEDTSTSQSIISSGLMEEHAGIVITDTDTTTPLVYCGLTECEKNELCCFASRRCFNPSVASCGEKLDSGDDVIDTDSHSKDSSTAHVDSNAGHTDSDENTIGNTVAAGERCLSNADCAADAFCNSVLCMGPGTCQLRNENCTEKKPFPMGALEGDLKNNANYITYLEYSLLVCGCDGRNYESECAAYAHGVRVSGVTSTAPCGGFMDAQSFVNDESLPSFMGDNDIEFNQRQLCNPHADICEQGLFCCEVTFTCMPEAERERCFVPDTPGYPCTEKFDDCQAFGWETCQRPGCGSEGVCTPTHDDCNELAPVCGCDGVSYLNICAADEENVSVAHEGECLE